VPGLRDAVRDGETGLLYTYGDVDELAGRIKTLLTDADRRRRLEEEAYRWAATFDWDDMAEKTIGLLRNLISSGSTR
jgi:glycosyltransferase involved in cell wall biosynthesis